MEFNLKIRELIAIGASITVNCQPGLKTHMENAITYGACQEEIAAAMEIGSRIRKNSTAHMETYCSNLRTATVAVTGGVVMEGNGYQFLGP